VAYRWWLEETRAAYVAFPANHLLAVELACQGLEGGFDDTAAEAKDEVEG